MHLLIEMRVCILFSFNIKGTMYDYKHWRDVQRNYVVNNADMSSLRAQNDKMAIPIIIYEHVNNDKSQ